MSFRTIIILTSIVAFAVFFAVMWQRYSVDPPIVAKSAAEPQMAHPPISSVAPAAQPSTEVADTANADPAAQKFRTVPGNANVDATPSDPNAPVESEMPVQIRFRHVNNLVLGTIVNESKAQLSVAVIDQQSGTQTTVDLEPRIPAMVGVRDGLELHSGDEVTVRAGSYREVITKVQ